MHIMKNEFIVITSISAPNRAMRLFADGARERGVGFLVAGDTKSPGDFELEGCEFLSLEDQLSSGHRFAQKCPTRHYARKNIAYLEAIARGAEVIRDTDDDNLPRTGFWDARPERLEVRRHVRTGWANVYRWFSDALIWPRGLPLDEVRAELPRYEDLEVGEVSAPIHQGLADENPDVDAVYRLLFPLPQNFEKGRDVALGRGVWCPFNSQNTTWFREAFPLMYLPAYCSFRMTDIWRSFVAQRIGWENGWEVVFHEATVWQERNEHNLMRDFEDEVPGYVNNRRMAETLEGLSLRGGVEALGENLVICYEALCSNGWVGREEVPLLESWLADLGRVQAG